MRFDRYLGFLVQNVKGRGWRCTNVLPLADGGVCLYADAGSHGKVVLIWGVDPKEARDGTPARPRLRPETQGAPARLVEQVERRLVAVLEAKPHSLFAWRGMDLTEVAVARGGELPAIWSEHLSPGRTEWGPYTLDKVEVQAAAFYLVFCAGENKVRLRVSDVDDPRIEPGQRVVRVRNLAVSVTDDDRADEDRAKILQRVELFVAHVLAHNSGPDTRIVPPRKVAPNVNLWNKVSIVNQFMPEGKQGASSIHTVLSGKRRDFFVIHHGDASCRMTFPPLREMKAFDKWAYFPVRSSYSLRRSVGHDFSEDDIVRGAEDKLRSALAHAKESAPGVPVVVVQTCASRLIGDDVRGVIREVFGSGAKDVAVIEPDFLARDVAADSLVWSWALTTLPRKDVEPRERAVNLFGFGHREHEATAELVRVLEEAGVEVNCCLFPSFEQQELEGFRRAEVCVCNPCSIVRAAVRLAERKLKDVRWVFPPAPFGVEGTRRWVEAVLGEVGVPDAEAVSHAAAAPFATRLRALRDVAGVPPFAFSCDSRYSSFLFDPSESFGIPLLDVLAEAGVAAEVHLLADEPPPKDLGEKLRGDSNAQLLVSDTEEGVRASLALSRAGFLFTSIEKNDFALAVGMLPLYARFFEMGFAGAVRTVEKLQRLSQLRFCDDYRSYLGV